MQCYRKKTRCTKMSARCMFDDWRHPHLLYLISMKIDIRPIRKDLRSKCAASFPSASFDGVRSKRSRLRSLGHDKMKYVSSHLVMNYDDIAVRITSHIWIYDRLIKCQKGTQKVMCFTFHPSIEAFHPLV